MTWVIEHNVTVRQEDKPYITGQLKAGDVIEVRSSDGTWAWERDLESTFYEVSKVYDELSGGRFSKPNTSAVYVIEAAHERADRDLSEYRELLRTLFAHAPEDSGMDGLVFLQPDLTDDQSDLIYHALSEVTDDE